MGSPRQKQDESYEDACKRYSKNLTTKHLYPNLSKALKTAKQASLNDNLKDEKLYLHGIMYGCQRRISEIDYKLEQNKLLVNKMESK
jgi:hypothetical protein